MRHILWSVFLSLLLSCSGSQQQQQHYLMSRQQLATCQQASSKADPVGSLSVAGCPLTLLQSRDPSAQQLLLLEPAACVSPGDLRRSLGAALAYNHVRNQVFFQLPILLHHRAFLAAAAAALPADEDTRVAALTPTEVDVSVNFRPRHFSVDNARLVENGSAALVAIYCDREVDCRRLQEQISAEPDYFLEILQLRLTVQVSPSCYKTLTVAKKVTRMTRSPDEPAASEGRRPEEGLREARGERDDGGEGKASSSKAASGTEHAMTEPAATSCNERSLEGSGRREHLRRLVQRIFTTRVSGLAYFDFRLSCRNLLAESAAVVEAVDIVGDGGLRRHGYGIVLTGADDAESALVMKLPRSLVEAQQDAGASPPVEMTLRVLVLFQSDGRTPHHRIALTNGSCSANDSSLNRFLLAETKRTGRTTVLWGGRRYATKTGSSAAGFELRCLQGRRQLCSLAIVATGPTYDVGPPRLFVDKVESELELVDEAPTPASTTASDADCRHRRPPSLQLMLGSQGSLVACVAVAWGPRSSSGVSDDRRGGSVGSDFDALESVCGV